MYLVGAYRVSERCACRLVVLPRATHRYQSIRDPLTELRLRMRQLAQTRIRYGYRKIRVLLIREGWKVGKKLVYRLYREEGLGLRRRPKARRTVSEHSRQKPRVEGPNQVWSLDFVADELTHGRRFRALTVVDVYTRECLAIEVGQSLKGHDVVRVLQQIAEKRGMPRMLFCDNGSEFTSQVLDLWAYHNQVKIDFSRPGKPTDNAYVESFNGTLRAECLDAHWFGDLAESTSADRVVAYRLQCEPSSQGTGRADAKRICQRDRG
jgi:putative transposase